MLNKSKKGLLIFDNFRVDYNLPKYKKNSKEEQESTPNEIGFINMDSDEFDAVAVGGWGSFFFQYVTRDNYSFCMKCTYAEYEIDGEIVGIDIFKDPITDSGMKKSARGLTAVFKDENGEYYLKDQATWEEINNCELKTVFKDGKILHETTLTEIRERIKQNM